jgi:hypothetical protein
MPSSLLLRKSYLSVLTGLVGLVCLLLLAACGTTNTPTSTGSTPTTAPTTQPTATVPPATATETALFQLVTLVGQPTAKILSGTTFQVTGQVKNGDSHQHDIYVQVTLLDASGTKIVSVVQNVDNVPANTTVTYHIKGTTPQSTWASVQAIIQKITENVGSTGGD